MNIQQLPIDEITLDPRLQTRATMNMEAVEDYAEHLDQLPPCNAFLIDGEYFLTGGWHRHMAHKSKGRKTLPCVVTEGTFNQAKLEAAGQNHGHGVHRTNADKRKTVAMILQEPEWTDRSNRWIAEQCNVSEHTVASCRPKPETTNGKADVPTAHLRSRNSEALCDRCKRVGKRPNCQACEDAKSKQTRTSRDGRQRPAAQPSATKQTAPPPTPARPPNSFHERAEVIVQAIQGVHESLREACGCSETLLRKSLEAQQKKLALVMADIDLILEKPTSTKGRIPREDMLGKFVKPTLEQVAAYCKDRGNKVDPETWLDHYTANGWKVGKNPMKDWQAAVRTWEKNAHGKQGRTSRVEAPAGKYANVGTKVSG